MGSFIKHLHGNVTFNIGLELNLIGWCAWLSIGPLDKWMESYRWGFLFSWWRPLLQKIFKEILWLCCFVSLWDISLINAAGLLISVRYCVFITQPSYAVQQINSKAVYCGSILTQRRQWIRTCLPFFHSTFLWFQPGWTVYNTVKKKKAGNSSYFSRPWERWIKVFLLECIKLCHFWHRFQVVCHDWCQSDI